MAALRSSLGFNPAEIRRWRIVIGKAEAAAAAEAEAAAEAAAAAREAAAAAAPEAGVPAAALALRAA